MKNDLELKRCPFCGGEAEIFSGFERYKPICSNNKCVLNTAYKSETEAIKVWNTRYQEKKS